MLLIAHGRAGLDLAADDWPEPVRPLLQRLRERPESCDWLVPSRAHVEDRRRQSKRRASHGLPFLRPQTMDDFTRRLWEQIGSPMRFLTEEERLVRLVWAWHEAAGASPAAHLLRRLSRLAREHLLTGESLEGSESPPPFDKALAHYQQRLNDDNCHDLAERPGLLARELSHPTGAFADRLRHTEVVLVEGFHKLTPAEARLLGLLARQVEVLVVVPRAPHQPSWSDVEEGTAQLRAAAGDKAFVVDIPEPAAERSSSALPGLVRLDAANPQDVLESVAAHVKSELRKGNADLKPSDIGVVLLDPADEALARAIFHEAGLPMAATNQACELRAARVPRLLRLALDLIVESVRPELLADFLSHPAVKRRREEMLLTVLASMRVADSLPKLAAGCLCLLDSLRPEEWLAEAADDRESAALGCLRSILQAVTTLPDSTLRFVPALVSVLDAATYTLDALDSSGIRLVQLEHLPGLRFRQLFVLDLGDAATARVANTVDPGWLSQCADERLLLCRLESPEVRGKTAGVADSSAIPAAEPVELLCSRRSAQRLLGKLGAGEPNDRALPLAELWPAAVGVPSLEQAWADLRAWRSSSAPGRELQVNADLLASELPTERAFTPAELEDYAACPFRFFATRVVGVGEQERPSPRLRYHQLLRRVVADFHEELRRAKGLRADEPLPPPGREELPRLVELFRRAWREQEPEGLPPEMSSLALSDDGVLDWFLRGLVERESSPAGFGNLLHDLVFPQPDGPPILLGPDDQGKPVLLAGRIDRVDVAAGQARIVRYRTGKPPDKGEWQAKAADGRLLQLPLQAVALEQLRPDLHAALGLQVHLSERARLLQHTVQPNDPALTLEPLAAREKALELVSRLRSGRFPLTIHGPDASYPECTARCAIRHACRHPDGCAE